MIKEKIVKTALFFTAKAVDTHVSINCPKKKTNKYLHEIFRV